MGPENLTINDTKQHHRGQTGFNIRSTTPADTARARCVYTSFIWLLKKCHSKLSPSLIPSYIDSFVSWWNKESPYRFVVEIKFYQCHHPHKLFIYC